MFIEGNHGEGLRSPGNRIVELCDRGSGKGEPPARLRLVRREPPVGALHILHLLDVLDSLSSLNTPPNYLLYRSPPPGSNGCPAAPACLGRSARPARAGR